VVRCLNYSFTGPGNPEFEVWPGPLPAPDYFDALQACRARYTNTPAWSPPPSRWLNNQRKTYTDALKRAGVDIIVAPFQVQGYALERTERALMSADLAYHLDPAVRVADPFLTARALGEGVRRYETDDIVELARATGARTAIVGYVGHHLTGRMTVTIQVLKIDANGVETLQRDWRDVSFTHADPPFVVFHRMLPSVLESLGLPTAKQPHERAPVVIPDEVASSFADFADGKSPLAASVELSLLGALTMSSDELSRERLFERALVTSWHFDTPSEDTAFLRAYALLNLEHRPAALALINGATSPEAVSLRALLNGDLPGAAAAAKTVEHPLKRLLLSVHVDDLRYLYGRENVEQATDGTSVFAADAQDWLFLAEGRTNDLNIWYADASAALKFLLDEVHPVAGLGLQSVLGGGQVVGADVDDVALAIATTRHVARFVADADVPVCCTAATARASSWDLVQFLEGRTASHMRDYLHLRSYVRAAPDSATDAIERYRSVFEGLPLFAAARAEYANQMKDKADGDALQRWQREASEQAYIAAAWSPGQGGIADEAMRTIGFTSEEAKPFVDAYGFDYPRRPEWLFSAIRSDQGMGIGPIREVVRALREAAYPYARTSPYPFRYIPPLEAEKPRFVAALEGRFIGHPHRPSLMATLLPPREPSGDPVADAKAAVDADPDSWGIRLAEGRKLIEEHGEWDAAAELLLAYPHFHRESPPNMVVVSNSAYDAGSIFYWRGHEDLAVPFYEIAAGLQTGAESQMTSTIRLAILERRYRDAAGGSYARAQRYPDAYPFRDLLSFMHTLGYPQEAWEGFSQVASQFSNPQVWLSALVGQRREGLPEAEIRAWLKQPGIRDARFRNGRFALRYAVLVNAVDRMPPEDLGALVAELEGQPVARVTPSGGVERPDRDGAGQPQSLNRSSYSYTLTTPIPAEGTPVKSEFAFFGAAYAAIRHGRFDEAVEQFKAMSMHYPIEYKNHEFTFALPYFAWAAAKTGDAAGFEKYLNEAYRVMPAFDLNLARAFFHGVRKETTQARELLAAALRARPFTDYRPVLVEYQWAEACEWLYQETGDAAFVDMLLAWLRSEQKVDPTHAWAYAMEYTYARDAARRRHALAMTLYLDPLSPRIQGASAKERAEAEAWGAENNPFLQEQEEPGAGGPTARVGGAEKIRGG
jgi:hypothetical protein